MPIFVLLTFDGLRITPFSKNIDIQMYIPNLTSLPIFHISLDLIQLIMK